MDGNEGLAVLEVENPSPKNGEVYCKSCGKIINKHAVVCPHCGVQNGKLKTDSKERSKLVASLLAIFLGTLGIHKFYLGKTGMGILYIIFSWTGIPSVIGLIEGIIYFSMKQEKFDQKYNSY